MVSGVGWFFDKGVELAFVRVVVEDLVEFRTGLHPRGEHRLGSFRAEHGVKILRCASHHAESAERV
jgi:hypothetical protein